jgi:hypothetical protein
MQRSGMTIMLRLLPALLLVGLLAAGCTQRQPAWGYSGPDEGLKHPLKGEAFEVWQRRAGKVLQDAKDACTRETGYSETPPGSLTPIWEPNGDAFWACMKARGWSTYSNPL